MVRSSSKTAPAPPEDDAKETPAQARERILAKMDNKFEAEHEEYNRVTHIEPGAERVRGYLPCGSWVSLWTALGSRGDVSTIKLDKGEWREFDAPLGKPAVFARAGAESLPSVTHALQAAGLL